MSLTSSFSTSVNLNLTVGDLLVAVPFERKEQVPLDWTSVGPDPLTDPLIELSSILDDWPSDVSTKVDSPALLALRFLRGGGVMPP